MLHRYHLNRIYFLKTFGIDEHKKRLDQLCDSLPLGIWRSPSIKIRPFQHARCPIQSIAVTIIEMAPLTISTIG
jgi:hypothetical protein